MASAVTYEQAGSIKKGSFVVLRGKPCKVMEVSWAKPGKHGSAKVTFVALDLFSGKKVEGMSPTSHTVEVPIVTRSEAIAMNITDEGYLSVLLSDGSTRNDLRVHQSGLRDDITANLDAGVQVIVTVISALGRDEVVDFKLEKE